MLAIPLSNTDRVCIIDDEDFDKGKDSTWRATSAHPGEAPYIRATKRIGKMITTFYIHRLIMQPTKYEDTHHRDENTFDNRKSNLENIPNKDHRGHPRWTKKFEKKS